MSQQTSNQFSCAEYCDRIKYEYEFLQIQHNVTKVDVEKMQAEKKDLKQQARKFYETSYYLNLQLHKQSEINSRLQKLLQETMKILPKETAKSLQDEMENAFNVSTEDIEKRIKSQFSSIDPYQGTITLPDLKKRKIEEPKTPILIEEGEKEQLIVSAPPDFEETSNLPEKDFQEIFKDKPVPKDLKLLAELPHTTSVSAVTFNKNGSRIFTAGKTAIKIWDNEENEIPKKPRCELKPLSESYIRTIKLTSDEKYLVTCGECKEITVWDVETEKPTIASAMESKTPYHYNLVLSPDSKYVYSCMSDGSIGMWSLSENSLIKKFYGHQDSVSCIDISEDGNTLISGGLDKTVKLWDLRSSKELKSYNVDSSVYALGFATQIPDKIGPICGIGLENSKIEILNFNTLDVLQRIQVHEDCVLSLKYDLKGGYFASCGKDSNLIITQCPYGPSIIKKKEKNSILNLDISPNSKFIVTGNWNKFASLYKVEF